MEPGEHERGMPMPDGAQIRWEAALLGVLLVTSRSWISRRVESLTFVGEGQVRRAVSVDFRLPDDVAQIAAHRLDYVVVPLGLMKRRLLVGFDLRDASGTSMSLLTREQLDQLCLRAVLSYVEPGDPGLEPLLRQMELLIHADVGRARALHRRLEDPGTASGQALAALRREQPDAAARLELVAGYFRDGFPLLIRLPVADASKRHVVKYAYEDPFWPRTMSPGSWRAGLLVTEQQFSVPLSVGLASASYHFEFETPGGLFSPGAQLVDGHGRPQPVVVGGTSEVRALYLLSPPEPMTADRPALGGGSGDGPLSGERAATIAVRARPEGLLITATGSSLASALLLTLGALAPGVLHSLVRSGDGGAAIALLLALPATYSAWIARPGEHLVASQVVRWLRYLTLASAVLLYVAAASIVVSHVDAASAVGSEPPVLRGTSIALVTFWRYLAGFAWVAALPLMIATRRGVRALAATRREAPQQEAFGSHVGGKL